jgi:hypothetical protein
MRRVGVFGKRLRIWIDPAQLPFPRVPVAIDEPGDEDHVGRIDRLRAGSGEIWPDRGDPLAFDQHVTGHEIADLGIERNDCAASQQEALARIERGGRRKALAPLGSIGRAGEREPRGNRKTCFAQ